MDPLSVVPDVDSLPASLKYVFYLTNVSKVIRRCYYVGNSGKYCSVLNYKTEQNTD